MEMRLILDTHRYIDFCRGVPEVVDTLRRADQITSPSSPLLN